MPAPIDLAQVQALIAARAPPPVSPDVDAPLARHRAQPSMAPSSAAGSNLIPSLYGRGADLVEAAEDPVGTAKGLWRVARAIPGGAMRELARAVMSEDAFNQLDALDTSTDKEENSAIVNQMWGDAVRKWGGLENIRNTIATDPASLLDIMPSPKTGIAMAGVLPSVRAARHRAAQEARKLASLSPEERAAIETQRVISEMPEKRTLGPMGDRVLKARAAQMDLPEAERVQPSGDPFFRNTPADYQNPEFMPPQEEIYIPRPPEGKALPKKGRSQILVDRREEIANILAERMRPHLGTEAQFFYNIGPIIQKGIELGIPREQMTAWMKDFAQNYAATSPRTPTAPNMRNASVAMARAEAGLDPTKAVFPSEELDAKGNPVISDRGYAMMTGDRVTSKGNIQAGIHKMLLRAVHGRTAMPGSNEPPEIPPGINPNTNTKPSVFQRNSMGNLSEATIDTHAIRGVLDALNELQPGAIPEGFIKKEFREAYKADPASFNAADWVDDKLESQMSGVVGPTGPQLNVKQMTEYAPFADLYRRAGEILGVSPAEAQSMGWFGSGSKTNLQSPVKSISTLLGERIDVTAQLLGISRDEVLKLLVKKKIPLAQQEAMPGVEQTAVG